MLAAWHAFSRWRCRRKADHDRARGRFAAVSDLEWPIRKLTATIRRSAKSEDAGEFDRAGGHVASAPQ